VWCCFDRDDVDNNMSRLMRTESRLKLARRAPAAAAAVASACGLTKGLLEGTRSSLSVWAKKHTRRLQLVPSLHSCVRYLHAEEVVHLNQARQGDA